MDALISELLPTLKRERTSGRALALAVVLRTEGSTYSKPGALMLITRAGECAGLLSGGCLEADLREHAITVIDSGQAMLLTYDTRGPDDLLFGLGAGCEGAMDIYLMRVGPEIDWQPFTHWQSALAERRRTAVGLLVSDADSAHRSGAVLLPGMVPELDAQLLDVAQLTEPAWLQDRSGRKVFALPLILPKRILLLGAGSDAEPLVAIAASLGWQVTVYDHRSAYAVPERFPCAERVDLGRPEALASTVAVESYDAVIVMSHHLQSDATYLRVLAASSVGYVGLLGPAPRRERLRAALGPDFAKLRGRLRSPVGLDLGGRSSAAIALSIVAEIHAWLHGRRGLPYCEFTSR